MQFLCVLLCALASLASAAPVVMSGTFAGDDQVQLFLVRLNTPGTLTVQSYGYGGKPSLSVIGGGFDTYLSLFDSAGLLRAVNEDGTCPPGIADPATGACFDAALTESLAAGTYLVALTQYFNLPFGPLLSDGFLLAGAGNYTPLLTGRHSGRFIDIFGNERTSNYTLAFDGASSVQAVPEPGTAILAGVGIAALWYQRRKRPVN